MTSSKDFLQAEGKIMRSLGNNTFRVELTKNKQIILATVTPRFRASAGRGKKKLLEGDRVIIEIPLDDLSKGRIISFATKRG
jgi:translation initiation factor IF-1